MIKRSARAILGLSMMVLLGTSCSSEWSQQDFKSALVRPHQLGNNFVLKDPEGKTRTLADFKGKVVLLFFGYTHCPDICPTTLSDARRVMDTLGEKQAQQVQFIFVTVDPERDTPALLKQYVPAFHPSFLGLYPESPQALEKITRDFKIFVKKVPGKDHYYSIDHSAGTYIFDKKGVLRLFMNYGSPSENTVHDIRKLLQLPD